MNALQQLSAWAAEVSPGHEPLAYGRARAAVKDTLACMAAGAGDPAARAVRAAIAGWGRGAATVVGGAVKVPAPWAALANGTAGHALDFDDYDDLSQAHSSAVLVPAVLAVAEERGTSGRAVLDAYVVGLEAIMRIGQAVNLSHYHLGWHATATLGALGAAVACARLQGLDAGRLGASLSLATSMAAGFKSQFGTLAKPAHAGLAAKTGVLAAQLAASGIDASPDTLDGEWSLLTRAAGPEAPGFAEPLAQLGKGLAIVDHGLVVKRFPCCSYIHKSLDGLLELRAGHGLTAADVAAVAITIPGRNTEILRFPSPETPSEARFSMEYCAAAALHQGTLTLADFTQAAVERPAVRAVLPRIRMTGYPVSAMSSDLTAQEPEVVTLELLSGDRLTASTTVVKGAVERPLSPDELSAKFRGCCELLLPTAAAVERAEILLDRLDALETVAEAMAGFAGPSDSVVAAQ